MSSPEHCLVHFTLHKGNESTQKGTVSRTNNTRRQNESRIYTRGGGGVENGQPMKLRDCFTVVGPIKIFAVLGERSCMCRSSIIACP